MKTRNCGDCQHATYNDHGIICARGHKPRFYQPKDTYAEFTGDWGWKRRCADFSEGAPKRTYSDDQSTNDHENTTH